MIFRVRGWFGRGPNRQRFTRELPALSKDQALERVYSEIGSKHKVKRILIHIEEVTELQPERKISEGPDQSTSAYTDHQS